MESQHKSSVPKRSVKVKPGQELPPGGRPQDEVIEPLLTVKEAARVLKIHPITFYKNCYKRKLPYIKLDGVGVRVRPADLREFIERA